MLLSPPRRSVLLASLALLAFAVFFPSFSGELVSDDAALIEANSHGVLEAATRRFWQDDTSARGLYREAYRPATQVPLAALLSLFGAVPPLLHLLNVLLHVAICLLALRWLTRRLAWPESSRAGDALQWAAFAAALLFALHPAHTESVAWISGVTDLWMTLWLLLGFELLERPGMPARAAATGCFALAALAKEPALLAPLLCWCDAWASGHPAPERRTRSLHATLGAALALTLIASRGLVGAGPSPTLLLQHSLAALGLYMRALLLPLRLTFQAPPFERVGDTLTLPGWSLILGALTLALALVLALRARRSPVTRALLADLLWLLIPLAPPLLLQPTLISDRFLYAPLLGVSALAARGLAHALLGARSFVSRAWAVATLLVLLSCGALSLRATAHFQDEESLWRSQVAAFPEHWKAMDALAERLLLRGESAESRRLFERGLVAAHEVGQRDWQLHFLAHLAVLGSAGQPPWDPSQQRDREHCDALFGAGKLTFQNEGRPLTLTVTRRELDTLLLADPQLVALPCAQVLLATQRPSQAAVLARDALTRAPTLLAAREVLALALARSGQFDQALNALHEPGRAVPVALLPLRQRIETAAAASKRHEGRGPRLEALSAAQVALLLGDTGGARVPLAALLEADPTDHDAVYLLAQSHVAEQRFEPAERALRNAAALAPADPFWAKTLEALLQARANAAAR